MNANFYTDLVPATRSPGQLALIAPGRAPMGYGDLDRLVARIAGGLAAAGVGPGERVAVQVEKSVEALALYLACLRGGFVYTPINTAYRDAETRYQIEDCAPTAIACQPAREAEMRDHAGRRALILTLDEDAGGSLMDAMANARPLDAPAPVTGDAPALLLYTSGTTGRPKGAKHSHASLRANTIALARAWSFGNADRLLHALPLFHAHGLTVSSQVALFSGAAMIWLPRFEIQPVLDWLPHATVFMAVPTVYARLLASPSLTPERCRAIRMFASGSAPLSHDTFQRFQAATGHRIVERYGMTETGINASNPINGERKETSVGLALDGVEIRIVDGAGSPLPDGETGEVQIRGTSLCSGYWQKPEETAKSFTADGWFLTGDVGRIDADGYLSLVSRVKDIIITGGYNVYPVEVEAALEALPGISEATVIGVPHADFGEGVIGVVVPELSANFDELATLALLKAKLANYKVPKRLIAVPALPRSEIGKVLKAPLRQQYMGLLAV